jgi:hypothetical protein
MGEEILGQDDMVKEGHMDETTAIKTETRATQSQEATLKETQSI